MIKSETLRTSLAVPWLRLHTSTVGGTVSIPGWGNSTCNIVQPKKRESMAFETGKWSCIVQGGPV